MHYVGSVYFTPATAGYQAEIIEQPSALNRGLSDYLIDLTARFERLDY